MKHPFITTALIFILIPLLAQSQYYGGLQKNAQIDNSSALPSIQDYLKKCKLRSDTIWLPKQYDLWLWDGSELSHDPLVIALEYNDVALWKDQIHIDYATGDSLQKLSHEYDESQRKTVDTYYNYNKTNSKWVKLYRGLYFFDQFGNTDTTLVQAWDNTLNNWRDSVASVDVFVDTLEYLQSTLFEIKDGIWDTTWSYKWVNYFGDDDVVDSLKYFQYNIYTKKWETKVLANFINNEQGQPEESYWYSWTLDTNNQYYWKPTYHYTNNEWYTFNTYINNYKNRIKTRNINWWFGDKYYPIYVDSNYYHYNNEEELYHYSFYYNEGDTVAIPYLYLTIRLENYEDGNKRKYTRYFRDKHEDPLVLDYLDSCVWTYYKGSLESLYRIQFDTAKKVWHPAARALYTNFVPFVNTSTGLQQLKTNNEKLIIKPNPANQSVSIESDGEIESISIYSLEGRLVKEWSVSHPQSSIMLDINDLPSGTYIIDANIRKKHRATAKLMVR